MGYLEYGIDRSLVERIKLKMKNKFLKEHVKTLLEGVTKEDLQNRREISRIINQLTHVLDEKPTERMVNNIIDFVIAQRINPHNTFHLIKLWGIFR